MMVLDLDHCTTCDGTGYLVDQTYGTAAIPDGAVCVQRCDYCMRWAEDECAAHAAYLDLGAREWGFSFDGETFDPASPFGEFWIIPSTNREGQ